MIRAASHNLVLLQQIAATAGFSNKRFAMELGFSVRTLRRFTRARFGCSPQEWLDEQRLRAAPELLKKQGLAKIVFPELGFKQLSHFSRKFKQFYGLTPSAFLGLCAVRSEGAGSVAEGLRAYKSKQLETTPVGINGRVG